MREKELNGVGINIEALHIAIRNNFFRSKSKFVGVVAKNTKTKE